MNHTYQEALSKAAHDLMAMTKDCQCGELTAYEFVTSGIFDALPEGSDFLRATNEFLTNMVWSEVAAGVVLDHYDDVDSTEATAEELRFELACALDALRAFNSPVMPSAFLPYLHEVEDEEFFEDVLKGIYPARMKQQEMDKLKQYAKEYCEAKKLSFEMLQGIIRSVRSYIEDNPSFIKFSHVMAMEHIRNWHEMRLEFGADLS
ncbi:hypothetical protein IT893_18875 [Thalassospira sp. A40-3]|uniref:hypothetical protein n=1 Tax=Thalassospira sp. A40-3 TaxID=2785908 RepID=UPI0018CDA3AB|nr:hypothetical protein [Thalassospira sp. A40-3]QPO11730.1 hypothetical protein IT893_18875 [Thalassospira sp. A40-3]